MVQMNKSRNSYEQMGGLTQGCEQWRSQTRAHTGLASPGVSNAKVLRRRVSTATRLCTVALQQYPTPGYTAQSLSCLGTRTTLVP